MERHPRAALVGTLNSARAQVVMENLLQAIVEHSATTAIIDITGVPTVDTLVAEHLLKTVAAARLMGADCIVSGIGCFGGKGGTRTRRGEKEDQ